MDTTFGLTAALTSETMGQADAPTPWGLYRSQLIAFLRGRGEPEDLAGLQISADLQPALWDNPTYGTWLAWEGIANTIPLWGDFYRPSPGNRVTQALMHFLTNLELAEGRRGAGRQAVISAHATLREAMAAEERYRDDVLREWRTLVASSAPAISQAYRAWAKDTDRARQVRTRAATVWSLSQELAGTLTEVGGDSARVGEAILAYNNPAYQTELVDDSGAHLTYRRWTVRPALSAFLDEARAGKADKLYLEYSAQSSIATGARAAGAPRAPLLATGFLRVGRTGPATAGAATLRLTEGAIGAAGSTSEPYSFTFRSEGFIGIDLTPGPWYDGDVIRRFRDGPFLKGGPFGSGRAKFWGDGGVFPFIPARVYVAYQPSIRASVGAAALAATRTAWEDGLPIGIGPFEFSKARSNITAGDQAAFDCGSRTIELQSMSRHGMIVAMSNRLMPCGSSDPVFERGGALV